MRPDSRALRLLIAPAVAAVVLTGCGGSDDAASGDSGAASSDSAEPSESASSDEAPEELTADDFGERVFSAFEDAGTLSFTTEADTAGQTVTGNGEADLSGDELRSKVELETPQGPGEVIAVDGLFYIKLPQLSGEKFLRVDPDDESGLGALVGQLGGSSDPSEQVRVFEDATEVTAGEQEEVDGVQTIKYRVVLPREAVAESLGADEQVTQLLPEEIAYDVWVDADDLIRRLVSEIEVQGQTSTTTVTYTGYGEPVEVEAPPAAEVTDAPAGAGAGG